ncbi:NAD(P)-binding protein [Mesorhizobium sp. VK22B]|uniref:NAD(P)-binding protein n=1 Tax=Mesorhizobium captivum TaxID=3072319 RepID=A0ABU4Z6C1_9HYPH|nr:NAD(P)-binding protein [Mesorhizobium sp. VK22B]MDX8494772.1 NAD(P)-binding protein [Mesorhizobium sp. VK22B]
MDEEFDAITVGAGQSGPSLAVRLAEQGQEVALIEREHLGGTCVRADDADGTHSSDGKRAHSHGVGRPQTT